ncbi:MAG TPA: HAD-IB family phosphatase [Actinomycetota bacterium]|nr:HAD-IB family phosphatase [Actinomycetota bacterium]
MLEIGAILVDFDGTACLHDVAEHLLEEYGDPSWPEYDEAWARGEMDGRAAITAQAAMVDAAPEDLVGYAIAHCSMDPTFAPFVEWSREREVPVTLVSDGFGLYIEPLLRSAGIDGVTVVTNRWNGAVDALTRISFANGHPECVGCGTCKMLAVQRARAEGPVVFVGEGQSDRYGALYSDLVFAKDALVAICEADGVPFLLWNDFDDVRGALEGQRDLPGPVAPARCPGWRLR